MATPARLLAPALLALLLAGGHWTGTAHAATTRHSQVKHSVVRPAVTKPAGVLAIRQQLVVQTARRYLGYPYATYGDTPAGFSCIGFVHYVYAQSGVYVPEDLWGAYTSAPRVAAADLQPGDVLLFSGTMPWYGLSHAAIYIGGGYMIGADNFTWGVHLDYLWDSYWSPRYTGAVRPLA